MALVTDPLFKNTSGRVGDLLYKQINGKTFVYYSPKAEKRSASRNTVLNRNKFTLLANFCSALYESDAIRILWKSEYPNAKGSAYNILIKHFSKSVTRNDILKDTEIFPDYHGVNVDVREVYVKEKVLNINMNPIKYKRDFEEDVPKAVYFQLIGFAKFSNPVNADMKEYEFVPFGTDIVKLDYNEEIQCLFSPGEKYEEIYDNYKSIRVFFGYVFTDKDRNIIATSRSFDMKVLRRE